MQIRHTDLHEMEKWYLRNGSSWVDDVCEDLCSISEYPRGRVLVAEEDGRPRAVLGFEMIRGDHERTAQATISVLSVDPEHDNRGFGSRLVRFAEGIARINGCLRVFVAPHLERWSCGHCWGLLGYDDLGPGLRKTLESPIQKSCA